jgi:DNA-binding CsgD family transcriptional regulator
MQDFSRIAMMRFMPQVGLSIKLSAAERTQLEQWESSHGTPQQVALRCRIVLAAAEGQAESAIARELGINRKTVTLWRARFAEAGLESLWEIAPGRGRKPVYGTERIKAVVDATLQTKPRRGRAIGVAG